MDCFFSKNSLNWKAVIDEKEALTYKIIFIFWVTMAATWLMIATG